MDWEKILEELDDPAYRDDKIKLISKMKKKPLKLARWVRKEKRKWWQFWEPEFEIEQRELVVKDGKIYMGKNIK